MFFGIHCVICHREIIDEPIVSYWKSNERCDVTYAVCVPCAEKTHDKWLQNGYGKVTSSANH